MDNDVTLERTEEASDVQALASIPAEGEVVAAEVPARPERASAYARRKVTPIVPLADQVLDASKALDLIRSLSARNDTLEAAITKLKRDEALRRKCLRCGHTWLSYSLTSKCCPRCHSSYWDRPPKQPNARRPGDPPNPNWEKWRKKLDALHRTPSPLPMPSLHVPPSVLDRPDVRTLTGMPPPPPPPFAAPVVYAPPRYDEPQPEQSAQYNEIVSNGDTREVDVAQTAEQAVSGPTAEMLDPTVPLVAGSTPAIDPTLGDPAIDDVVDASPEEFLRKRNIALKEALGED